MTARLLLSTGSVPGHDVVAAFALAHQAGFDGLEVIAPSAEAARRELAPPLLRGLMATYGLPVVGVHAPFFAPRLGHYFLRPRAEARRSLAVATALADAVGAEHIVVHPFPALAFRGWHRRLMTDVLAEARASTSAQLTLEILEARQVGPLRLRPYAISDPDELYAFAWEHDLCITLDTAHCLTLGIAPHRFFRRFRFRINNIHLSDGDGRRCHLPLGQGRIDFAALFDAIIACDYDGCLTLEVETASLAELAACAETLKALLARRGSNRV